MMRMFEGVYPALITPFDDDGGVDLEGLKRNIEWYEDSGIAGYVPCGSTGESATLTFEEHKRVVEATVSAASLPVIAGTGSNNTQEALELTRHAEDAGADAAMLITPYYNKPNDSGMIQHYTRIADAVDIPIILYNVPGRTGINLRPDLVEELARHPNIAGVKEASGDLDQISRIIELTRDEDFVVLSGDDGMNLPILAMGGVGAISVVANIAPKRTATLVEAARAGNVEAARHIHYELEPLVRALFLETNPIPVKLACKLMGLASGGVRLPLGRMTTGNEAKLREVLVEQGLLEE